MNEVNHVPFEFSNDGSQITSFLTPSLDPTNSEANVSVLSALNHPLCTMYDSHVESYLQNDKCCCGLLVLSESPTLQRNKLRHLKSAGRP